jgi:hypothetical protein
MSSRHGLAGLQNLCHQGFLRRLLVALLMVVGKSNGDSLGVSLFYFSVMSFFYKPWDSN